MHAAANHSTITGYRAGSGTADRSRLGADLGLRPPDLLPRRHALRFLGLSHQERASDHGAGAVDAGAQSVAAGAAVPGFRRRNPFHAAEIPASAAAALAVGAAVDSPGIRHAGGGAA